MPPPKLLRYRHRSAPAGPLTRLLLFGTLPGVIVGAVIRVFAVSGPYVFRLIVAALLLPLGVWLCWRTLRPARRSTPATPPGHVITALALAVGVIGGIYGIGGGSILGPILAGRGMPLATVAPAALASTFATSVVGAGTYAVLAYTTTGDIAPNWAIGLLCGIGGLAGGYLGARLSRRAAATPATRDGLRLLLGVLAITVAVLYTIQALT